MFKKLEIFYIFSSFYYAYRLSTIGIKYHILIVMSSMVSEIQIKFAKRLKEIREKRNLSQEDLALLCHIDRTYIGRIERFERKPTIVILDKIANGLGIKLKDLLDF